VLDVAHQDLPGRRATLAAGVVVPDRVSLECRIGWGTGWQANLCAPLLGSRGWWRKSRLQAVQAVSIRSDCIKPVQ
jgi:hypothetical protein